MDGKDAIKQIEDYLGIEPPFDASWENCQGLLKELYTDDAWIMKNLVYSSNPLLKLIADEESFKGSYLPVPIK